MQMEDILQKAKGVVNVAAQKTGDAIDYSKVKFEIMRLNSELKGAYEVLGKAYYRSHQEPNDNEEALKAQMEKITTLIAKIEELNAQLDEKKKTSICPLCASKNVPDSVFCAKCGARIHPEAQEESTEEMPD